MPIDGKDIIRQYDELKQGLANRMNTLQLAAPFIDPSRGSAQTTEVTPGQPWMTDVFDSHAISVADLSAYYIQGKAHSRGKKSFSLRERREWLNEQDEVREWLEHAQDVEQKAIDNSNFYEADLQTVKDFWSWGPGSALIEEREFLSYRESNNGGYRGLHCSNDMIGRFVAGWDSWGQPNRHGIERMWSAFAAVERFGYDNVSEKIQKAYDNGKNELFKFVHFASPRKDGEYGDKAKQKMPFKWCWVEYDSKKVCQEGGWDKFRALVPRQNGLFGEDYGRGRADICLNDVITKNTAKRLELEAATLAIRPVTFVRAQVLFSGQNLIPGSFPVANYNGQRPLSDLFHNWNGEGSLQWSQVMQDQLKQAISEVFFVDHLRQAIALEGKHEQTAFERAQLEREILSLIGPIYAPYTTGFTTPFIDLLFDDLYRAGEFGDPPDILLNEGGQIDVVYDSPLTAVQAADEVQAMLEFEQRMLNHATLMMQSTGKPSEVLDLINWEDFYRTLANKMKVPSGPIRSGREVAMIANSKAEMERNQMINQELAGGAEALGKVAPFLRAVQGDKKAA